MHTERLTDGEIYKTLLRGVNALNSTYTTQNVIIYKEGQRLEGSLGLTAVLCDRKFIIHNK
jgi:hypothetical protein